MGLSDDTLDWESSHLERHEACEATFGEGARMVTTEEYFFSGHVMDITTEAWIMPVAVASSGKDSGSAAFDVMSGAQAPAEDTLVQCAYLRVGGRVGKGCDAARRVACAR